MKTVMSITAASGLISWLIPVQSIALEKGPCSGSQRREEAVNSITCSGAQQTALDPQPAMHSSPYSSPSSGHCTCGNTLSAAAPWLQLLKRLCRGTVVSADHFRLHNAQWPVSIRSSSDSGSFGFTLRAIICLRSSWWIKSSEEILQSKTPHEA